MIYQPAKLFNHIAKSLTQQTAFNFSWPLFVALFSAVGVLGLSSYQTLGDPDTFLHIRIGQWIIDHSSVPRVDVFSHSLAGENWVAHEWLSEIILATVYRFGGWGGLVLLATGCLSITLAYLTHYLQGKMPPIYALLFVALTFFALSTHLLARPHVLVWPLLVVWAGSLMNAQEESRAPSIWLIVIMILWVNLHGSFIFGLALILPIALQAVINSTSQLRPTVIWNWSLFFGMASMSCLLNPQGIAGAVFPLQVLNLQHLGAINEWMPYQFKGINPLEILLFVYLLLALLGLLRLPFMRIVMLLGLIHMALTHNRYVSILGLVSPLLIATSFGQSYADKFKDTKQTKIDHLFLRFTNNAGSYAICFSILIIGITALWGSYLGRYAPPSSIQAKAAIDAYQSSNHGGPILNDYKFGGALIYRNIPVFVDGRADLYDKKVMGPYIDAVIDGKSNALEKIINQYQITWALLSPDSPAITFFDNKKTWQRYYADSDAVIYLLDPNK